MKPGDICMIDDSILLINGFDKEIFGNSYRYVKENCVILFFTTDTSLYANIIIDEIVVNSYRNKNILNDKYLSKYIRKSKLEYFI
jgi:hypothetical protein